MFDLRPINIKVLAWFGFNLADVDRNKNAETYCLVYMCTRPKLYKAIQLNGCK